MHVYKIEFTRQFILKSPNFYILSYNGFCTSRSVVLSHTYGTTATTTILCMWLIQPARGANAYKQFTFYIFIFSYLPHLQARCDRLNIERKKSKSRCLRIAFCSVDHWSAITSKLVLYTYSVITAFKVDIGDFFFLRCCSVHPVKRSTSTIYAMRFR